MTDFGNRRWPALPKVSQQRRDELRTEPRELTRGRTRPARVSRTVFRIQKSPTGGFASAGDHERTELPSRRQPSILPVWLNAESRRGCRSFRRGRSAPHHQAREVSCSRAGSAARRSPVASAMAWAREQLQFSYSPAAARTSAKFVVLLPESDSDLSPLSATRIRERPMLRRMVPWSPLTISTSNFSNSKA